MPLRVKVVLIVLAAAALYVALDYGMQRWVVQPQVVALEREGAKRDVDRCVAALRRELRHLDRQCIAWAAWEDTWAFVNDQNVAYEASNLALSSFARNDLNLVYMVDTKGNVVWGKAYDLESATPIELLEFPDESWPVAHPLLNHGGTDRSVVGVFTTVRGPMLVASRPICSVGPGESCRGTLILGRFLTDETVATIEEQTHVAMRLRPLRGAFSEPEEEDALRRITASSPDYIADSGDEFLTAYTTFPDVQGNPAILIRVDVPRDLSARGAQGVRPARLSTLAVALVALLLLVVLLRTTVVGPLSNLTDHVTRISNSDDLSVHLSMARQDEIGTLAREFNRMVRRIQHDMADRKRAEEALRQSEAKIRALVNTAPDGIITIDEEETIESFNPAAARMFGYQPKEVMGRKISMLMPGAHCIKPPGNSTNGAGEDRSTTTQAGREVMGRRADGAMFPMHLTLSEMVLGDRPMFTCIVRDITELKEMHARVAQAQHLAMIGEMGASVAHEIRNPLAGISGAIQVLRDGFPVEDQRRDVMEEVLGQVARVEDTVRYLLMFAKSWAPKRQRSDLRQLVEQVVTEAQAGEAFAGIRFVIEEGDDVSALIDPQLFEQVLWNLLHNAAQAMPGGGEVRWSFDETPSVARAIMTDTGPGIPVDVQDKVFRPFFTTKTQGTGLGLAICRRILESHRGAISISSSPGKGATVTLECPKLE